MTPQSITTVKRPGRWAWEVRRDGLLIGRVSKVRVGSYNSIDREGHPIESGHSTKADAVLAVREAAR